MISLRKALLGITLCLTLIPASSFGQSSTKKKKHAKATATAPADSEANPSGLTPLSKLTESATAPSPGVRLTPGEVLNFNTDYANPTPDKMQAGPMYTFKDSSEPMQPIVIYNDSVPEDQPFKTYIGYPKHKFSLSGAPTSVGAVWKYNDQDFNFRSSTTALGVAYQLVATPRLAIGVDYSHSTLSVDSATVLPYVINASTATLDTYFVHAQYCFFGSGNFNLQYCPGFDVGNDAYPILAFSDSTHLHMDKVQDVIVGLNFRVQIPVNDRLFIHLTPGYNYGTGIGNSGTLTSKSNSTMYGLLGARYEFNRRHAVGVEAGTHIRSAKLNGKIGNNTDTWTTNSTDVGGKVAYILTL